MTSIGKVGAALRTVVRREGAQLRGALFRLAAFGAAALALAALVATAGTAGDPYSGAGAAATKTGGDAWIVIDTGEAGTVTGRATPVALTAVQAPGRATTAGLALRAEIDWSDDNIRTIDTDPGGTLQWDRNSGRIRVCDRNSDGHLVRGRVTVDGKPVELYIFSTKKTQDFVRAGAKGKCREGRIADYQAPKNGKPKYQFKVCLARSDAEPDGYCNTSDSNEWPKGDIKNNSCWDHDKSTQEKIDCVGGVQEYCHQWQHTSGMFPEQCVKDNTPKEKTSLKPPVGRKPDINARPDLSLPRTQPGDVGKVTQPVAIMLRWLVWTVLGACVTGFVIVGGRMTIKHRRGEFGANAAEVGWVLLACVVAGSGCAIAFVALLVDPF
jgi:hypothetical protein